MAQKLINFSFLEDQFYKNGKFLITTACLLYALLID